MTIYFSYLIFLFFLPSFPSITNYPFLTSHVIKDTTIDLSIDTNGRIPPQTTIPVFLGTPPQEIQMKLSSSFCGLWVFNKSTFFRGFAPNMSKTISLSSTRSSLEFTQGSIVKDQISLCNLRATQVPFLLSDSSSEDIDYLDYDGAIGLGFNCENSDNTNVNIIELLIQSESKKMWDMIIYSMDDEGKGYFAIGQYNDRIDEWSKLYKKVNLVDNDTTYWKIRLYSVYFSDGSLIEVNNLMTINFDGEYAKVNNVFYEVIYQKFFKRAVSEDICKVTVGNMEKVICDKSFRRKDVGDISFVIGKFNFKITNEKLFRPLTDDGEKLYEFTIVHYKENVIEIPQGLITTKTIVYNREERFLGFYNGK